MTHETNPWDTQISFWQGFSDRFYDYTGKNANYRTSLPSFEEWDKTHGYGVVGASSSDSNLDSDNKYSDDDEDEKSKEELKRTTQLVFNSNAGKVVPRLREPRSLYGLSTAQLGYQQLARWPAEVQVLPERVQHILTLPKEPEIFFKPSGLEKTPLAVSHEPHAGQTVFDYDPIVGNFFLKSRVGGNRNGCRNCAIPILSETDDTLVFESRFESGNLAKAVKVGDYDYELWLRNDLFTVKHTQWFYFRIQNTRANKKYRFTIVNLMKPDSLYNHGMRPLTYSDRRAKEHKIGWVRGGSDIKYYRNNIKYPCGKSEKWYYSLTWTATCAHDRDTVYFAHCYPYTYSDMQDYLNDIQNDPIQSKYCKQRSLCRTLAGNTVYLLTITSPTKNADEAKHRKAVVVTARVHPGETNASWMMKGFLDYLMGNSADAKLLRDTFVFKIIPMLNPDGVIVGNYRCSLAGRDLNRNYKSMLKDSFPTVWHTKAMMKKLQEEREIIVYCDLHGHSRKQNVFIYGCENRGNPSKRLRERIFPVMLSKNAPDKFSFESCKFKVQKSKEGTGRIVMWNLGIMNSYTMEATFAGSTRGKMKGQHFSTADFESMGFHFCDTLLDYCDPDSSKSAKILIELEDRLKQELLQKLKLKEGELEAQNLQSLEKLEEMIHTAEDHLSSDGASSDSGGSDSSMSDGLPAHLAYMKEQFESKKKRLRSRKERDKNKNCKSGSKKSTTPDSEKKEPLVKPRPLKYHCGTVKRPKSKEGRIPLSPVHDKNAKDQKQRGNADETYLEAITNAYANSGMLASNSDPVNHIPHFRYTGGKPAPTINTDVCVHQDKAFAAQYVATHLRQHRDHLQQCKFPAERPFSGLGGSHATQKKHIVEVSAAQQRQQEVITQHDFSKRLAQMPVHSQAQFEEIGDGPIKSHPSPFDEAKLRERGYSARIKSRVSSAATTREYVKSAKSMPLIKRHDLVQSEDGQIVLGPTQGDPDHWEDNHEGLFKLDASREVTAVNKSSREHINVNNTYRAPTVNIRTRGDNMRNDESGGLLTGRGLTGASSQEHRQTRSRNGDYSHVNSRAVSRNGTQPPLAPNREQPITTQPVKSAFEPIVEGTHAFSQPLNQTNPYSTKHETQHGSRQGPANVELKSAMKSIQEIRGQLLDKTKRPHMSPTTEHFVEHFVRKTDQEISDITSEYEQNDAEEDVARTPRTSSFQNESAASLAIKKLKKKPGSLQSASMDSIQTAPSSSRSMVLLGKGKDHPQEGAKVKKFAPEVPDVLSSNPGRTAGSNSMIGRLRHVEHPAGSTHFRYGAECVGELEGSTVNTSQHHLNNFGAITGMEPKSKPPTRARGTARNLSTQTTQLYTMNNPLPLNNQTKMSKMTPVEFVYDHQDVFTDRTDHTDTTAVTVRTHTEVPLYSAKDLDMRAKQANTKLSLYDVSQKLQDIQNIPPKATSKLPVNRVSNEPLLVQSQQAYHPLISNKSAGRRWSQPVTRQQLAEEHGLGGMLGDPYQQQYHMRLESNNQEMRRARQKSP